jgi:peptide/nickel transport system permease protein
MKYLLRRFVHGLVVIFIVATLSFILIHLAPGDPFMNVSDESGLQTSAELQERLQRIHGLDQPIPIQYALYLRNLFRGDLGVSYRNGSQPILPDVVAAAGRTLLLGAAALIVNFGVGLFLGTWQAIRHPSRADRVLTVATLVVYSLPVFWFGYVLVFLFVERLGLFPVIGGHVAQRLVLPSLTLGLIGAAATARFHRAAMLNVKNADYVRTAVAKGLSHRDVVVRHILRNALTPVITLLGLSLPLLLSGSVFVERVFQWNGLGNLAVNAVQGREYNVVMATTLIVSLMVIVSNFVADLLHRRADPRARATT